MLPQVLVRLQELQRKLPNKGTGWLRRTLELLHAGGYEQEVAALEQELRDCVNQLTMVLGIAQYTQVRPVPASLVLNSCCAAACDALCSRQFISGLSCALPRGGLCQPLLAASQHSRQRAMVQHGRPSARAGCTSTLRRMY